MTLPPVCDLLCKPIRRSKLSVMHLHANNVIRSNLIRAGTVETVPNRRATCAPYLHPMFLQADHGLFHVHGSELLPADVEYFFVYKLPGNVSDMMNLCP